MLCIQNFWVQFYYSKLKCMVEITLGHTKFQVRSQYLEWNRNLLGNRISNCR
uniref:Uncharacterized protein n=1 Tax=Arundo donax TaxID=35708 RepID=A0A0A9APP1_ARUDO